jgi:methyl-accepting chemotaxis protein
MFQQLSVISDNLIFNERLKGEKQSIFIRFGLLALLSIFIILILSTSREREQNAISETISVIIIISTYGIALILNIIYLILLNKRKYSLWMSFLLITVDIILISLVLFGMSIGVPSLVHTSGIILIYALFIVLSGRRYSFFLSIYTGILSTVSYIIVFLINGLSVVRFYVEEPKFSGISKYGDFTNVYFDFDDFVIRCSILLAIGFITGLISKNIIRLINKQKQLNDEKVQLRDSFIDNLNHTINTSKNTSETLRNSVKTASEKFDNLMKSLETILNNAKEQKDISIETARASEEINLSFEDIEEKVNEQSIKIRDASLKINELVEGIRKITESTGRTKDMSAKLNTIALNGSKVVESSLEAIKDIQESSEEIATANNIINDLAEQTNILAMNANIEAANAGSVGLGFKVVANEIRELSANSTDSVKKINDIVLSMREKIERGVLLSEKVGKILQDIIAGIENTNIEIRSISDITQDQFHSSSLIKSNMEEVVERTESVVEKIEKEKIVTKTLHNKTIEVQKMSEITEESVNEGVNDSKAIKDTIDKIDQVSRQIQELDESLSEDLEKM